MSDRIHTLAFLDPGHFHAALLLRESHPRVADEIFVYAAEGPELAEFVTFVEAFNGRRERPTRWRLVVHAGERALERLVTERPGDVVVLAGKNDRKMMLLRRLHDAGLHVLADKPWITTPEALADVRHVLGGGAVAAEIMTGRHEITSVLTERVVREVDVFGRCRTRAGEPAIRLASVHHLEKMVNGTRLRRPPWYFDVRVQGDGIADIPTHLVASAQRLVQSHGDVADHRIELLSARRWSTVVPRTLFRRVTGLDDFPPELGPVVDAEGLHYVSNAELVFRLRGIDVAVTTRWDLSEPPGGGDAHGVTVAGTRATVRVAQNADTGFRRRVFIEPRPDEAAAVGAALNVAVDAWRREFPGLAVVRAVAGFEIEIPAPLRTGHESHFARVLAAFLRTIDDGRWPDAEAATTLAKYEFLARALACERARAASST
jgi:predicted dehydrogenase